MLFALSHSLSNKRLSPTPLSTLVHGTLSTLCHLLLPQPADGRQLNQTTPNDATIWKVIGSPYVPSFTGPFSVLVSGLVVKKEQIAGPLGISLKLMKLL